MEENQKNKGVNKVEKMTEESAKTTASKSGKQEKAPSKAKTSAKSNVKKSAKPAEKSVKTEKPGAKTSAEKPEKKADGKKIKAKKQKLSKEEKKLAVKQKREKRKANAIERKQKQKEIKQAKKEYRLKKKIELKKLKEERHAEKLAKIKAKKKAHERKLLQIQKDKQEQKAKRKQEKQARRETIKNESKEERAKRIAEEKKAKKRMRLAAAKLKKEKQAEKRKVKAADRQARREQKRVKKAAHRENKKVKRESGRKNPNKGLVAAVIALGVSVLALASMFTFYYMDQMTMNAQLNNMYEKSFYDLIGYVDNLETNMSKLMVSNSAAEQQKLLTNLAVQSELAENNISQIPFNDKTRYGTAKVLNQIGDYSKTLQQKIASGKSLSEKEQQDIESLYNINVNLKRELQNLARSLDKDFKFTSLLDKDLNGNLVNDTFNDLENNSVEYPKMIYDGPFSDGLENQQLKGLNEPEITRSEAEAKFKKYFGDYSFGEINFDSETVSNGIESYNFYAVNDEGNQIYAQITKKGGKLVMFNCYDDCTAQNYSSDECIAIADKFLAEAGFDGMEAVWVNENGNVANINYAYTMDGTVVYSDLVKVKVCMEKGVVTGIEAMTYFLNHTEDRDVAQAVISEEEARAMVNSKLEITQSRKCIIPLGANREAMAYEFAGEYNGNLYYVYIDAATGDEAEVFRVVEGTEGRLLI